MVIRVIKRGERRPQKGLTDRSRNDENFPISAVGEILGNSHYS